MTREFSMGVSVLANKSEVRTTVSDTDSQTTVIDLTSKTESFAFLVGSNLFIPKWGTRTGLTYRSAVSGKLTGKSNMEGGSKFSAKSQRAHAFSTGIEQTIWRLTLFSEASYSPRSLDSGVEDPMQLASEGIVQRRDTLSYVSGIKTRVSSSLLRFSYGFYPSAVTNGIMASRDEEGKEYIGAGFGDLTAFSRHHFGIGCEYSFRSLRLSSSFSGITGKRSVPEWSRGYGDYELNVYTLSTSANWRF